MGAHRGLINELLLSGMDLWDATDGLFGADALGTTRSHSNLTRLAGALVHGFCVIAYTELERPLQGGYLARMSDIWGDKRPVMT